ncbi:MAG: class II aldolase/adducin family protein [Lachnospiraceae bacterium]|nr:class II aldolase/adducin family protein [Lachnospiraceae bacterium]
MLYENIRTIVLENIKEAVAEGLVKGTSGNIALRSDEDPNIVAITPSGIPYTHMTPDQISIIDLDGNRIDGPFKPSSEWPMHTEVLKRRPDINATVHTHAMFATILAMGDAEEMKPITPPQCEFTPVRIVPFTMPGSNDVARLVADTLGADGRSVLIKNHGMFTCGKNMHAAMAAATYTEEMALTTFYAKILGNYEPMPEEAIKAMKALIAADQAV